LLQGFEAYARIFFPFTGAHIEEDGEARQEHITRAQLAARNGRIAHALMEQETIERRPDGSFADLPHDPSFWWPDDRAWCVCTGIGFDWGMSPAPLPALTPAVRLSTPRRVTRQPARPAIMEVVAHRVSAQAYVATVSARQRISRFARNAVELPGA
jgi:hypothetical protein